jgi:hypothetical protein
MLLPFFSPVSGSKSEADAYKLKLNMFDRDLLSKNDFICDYEIDLRHLVEECRMTKRSIHLNKAYYKTYLKEQWEQDGKALDLEWED